MKDIIRQRKLHRPLIALIILLLAATSYRLWFAEPVSASGEVDQVWRNVQNSDRYAFTASVENKTIPLPTVGNIGRFSKTDTLYLEGENNLRDEELLLALWGGGVNVLDQSSAYQLRLADGKVETRIGDEEWQAGNELNVGFAPGGDFLAFLDVATDIQVVAESATGVTPDASYTIYQFNVDGPAYAQRLTRISQEHLVETNQLPAGVALQVPEHLQNLTGNGELWVDTRGLPVREIVTLNIPAAANTDYRTEAILDVQFNSYEGVSLAAIWTQPGRVISNIFARLPLPSLPQLGFSLTALLGVSLFMVILMRPNRRTQNVVFSLMAAFMLFTPLVQAQAASEQSEQLVAFKAGQEESAAAQDTTTDLAALTNTQPTLYTPPATPNQQPSTLDTDEDGLTDATEELLGTNRLQTDSDFDGITDRDEITGFTLGGQTWYGNPTVADSNNDSVLDGLEWNVDTDGDNTPDLYDFDDDGDGVPDKVDISRLVASKADNGTAMTFTAANPLQLTLTGLNPGSYTYVDLQLRPTNPDRLWYAFNVLNWPKDELGNMQDWDNATFFDHCLKSGGSNCTMSPDDNGEIKFVPMLEVALPDLSNLPRTSGNALDEALLEKYGIAIQPAGDGTYFAYVPLNLVEDPVTGAKVAFQAKLIYQAGTNWTPQQARMVWVVNVLNEFYDDAKDARTTITAGNGVGENSFTVLHAYTDDFYLTGFNVHESRGTQMAIVYEDPAVDVALNDDDALFQMVNGLEGSLMVNRDCDFVNNDGECVGNGQRDITINEINRRWNHPTNTGITNSQRWGIGDYLRVQTYTFAHEDQALFEAGGQIAPQILTTRFQSSGVQIPHLLYVREDHLRALNIDARNLSNLVQWTGHSLAVNFANEPVMATAGYKIVPYRYNTLQAAWEAYPMADYADHVRASFAATTDGLPQENNGPVVVEASAYYSTIMVVTMTNGSNTVINTDTNSNYTLTSTLQGAKQFFKPVDISDEKIYNAYNQAIQGVANRFIQQVRFNSEQFVDIFDLVRLYSYIGFKAPLDNTGGGAYDLVLDNASVNYRLAFVSFNAALLLGGVAGLILMNTKGRVAGEIIVQATATVGQVLDTMITLSEISRAVELANPTDAPFLLKVKTLFSFQSVSSMAFKAGAIGAIVGIGVSWIMFFSLLGKVPIGSVEFYNLLAGAIAATLVAIITFVISLTVVGAIVLAVFAIFDLFTLILCKAGVKAVCDFGLMAAITQAITDWVYQGEVMIDLSGKPPISNIEDLSMNLTNPEQGLVVGNSVRFEAELFTRIRHNWPKPSVVYHYGSFYTAQDLQSASVVYSLTTSKTVLNTERGRTTWWDAWPYDTATALVPSPGVGWLVALEKSKVLWEAARFDTILSPVYEFTTPKINQEFPLWLNVGMALPRYDCWFSVCTHKTAKSPTNTDLTGKFVLDILPNTVTGFYNWSALGVQNDFDGDGVPRLQDPNDTRWDTDSDGVPDQVEIEYGSSPTLTDKDGDGLNDALEIRYSTNPNRADTDGDGLTDTQEVNGYLVTIAGYTFRITSNPLQRDADKDGISDGTEYRLNQLDPVLFPFHPDVFNDSPVRLYTYMNDEDLVLAVSAQTVVTTTVFNGLPQNSLLAGGRFTSTLPVELGGLTQARNFTLLPSGSTSIVRNATAIAGSTNVTITTGVAADIVPVGTTPLPPFTDIILDNPVGVIIDNDDPAAPSLTLGNFVEPDVDVIIGGTASDPTSYVALVEVSVNGGAYITATGTSMWAFPVSVPNQPTGSIPIAVRVTDAVGHTRTGNFNLTIDGVAPVTTLDLSTGQTRVVRRNAEGNWTMALSGNSSDALAGIGEVSVQIGSSRAVTVTDPTGAWTLAYPFDDIAFNNDPNPTGPITMTVITRDNALPTGNAVTQIVPFVVDMTPPTVDLLSHGDDFQLTDGIVLTGTVQDEYTAVSGVEIAFVSAETVFATSQTWLHLPLNDLPETVLFNNVGGDQTQIYCLDATCPDSYVSGTDGTAAQFDGNDILRSFEDLTLPATERTIALWFNTTCANCGLFSSVQGEFPTQTEHDHDIFLDAGKVCVSFIIGPASRELRCSVDNSYNDGQWHQIVHTLGDNGNRLYLDGELAVSSPTTGSTFTTPDAVLVGYSPAAATPYFTGKLDDVVVYEGDMNATVAASLYRQWQPVTFIPDGSPLSATWAYTVPLGIEGYYQIDMRAADTIGNRSDSRGTWPQFRGPIDTKAPTFNVNVAYNGSGSAAQTLYTGAAYDANLTTTDYAFVCDLSTDQLRYETDPTELEFTQQENARLTGIEATCTQNGFQSSQISIRACDAFGHCAAAIPPQTVAYVGTRYNWLKPVGSLPNGIERTVLSDPQNREMLIARPGQIITDIAIDETHGKIYWGEMNSGDYNQPAAIWRANLDGSSVQQIIPSLTAYAPEALQIAVDPVGNKLYWTQGYQLSWANLDGTLPQVIYAVPDDPGFGGGNRAYHHIGDVAVDLLHGRLILSERRLRFDRPVPGVNIFNHSLVVATQLNGTSAQFVAGVGPGCTYANFYQNVGAGLDPTLCVDQTGGMDVESVAVVNGTAYWTAVDPGWTGSGVYGQPFGGATFTVAPLELNSSYPGLRSNPLPHLYIPPTGTAVYVSLAETIVRGETGGEFTLFSNFRDETPAPVGTQARLSSQITALAVTHTEQAVQTEPDLAVSLTSPAVVMLDGDSSRYQVTVRNNSGLPADSTDLTLALPTGATYTGSNGTCAAASTTVTCDLGRFPAFDQQTINISFTISASTLTQLSAAATVASATADANPADNSATSNSITAAPTLAALPGVPYVYYSTLSELVRIPLIGAPNPEPVQFDNGGTGGAIFAIDNARGYVFISNALEQLARVNLNGTGYTVIADVNPSNMPNQDVELSVAVDTASGRVYWTEVVTMVYTRIRSANNDGSDVQTIVPIVYGQKGILFDPIRNLLYWVGLDSQQRQYVIYRSNPDGSNIQVVHTAAAGAQIRDLTLDPYAQKLYWLDGVTDEGTLFRADSDGGNLAALDMYIGSDARGLVVLPAQNTLYYSKYGSLYQAELDGTGQTELVWLGNQRYYGVSNLDATVFPFIYINPPSSNLAYGLSTPYPASPCVAADPYELNDTPATATTLTAGSYAAALCRSSSDPSLGLDKDVYQVVVPAGQAITATLSSLPANYGLYIQRDDFTVDVSSETGTVSEQVVAANYEPTDAVTYTLTVFPSEPGNSFDTYQLEIELGVAPPNGYTNAQCLAVDPNDLPGEDGNHTFANATPLTVGTGIQGALCYENDSDFFKFTATAGQVVALDLPVRPADYSILIYAPDGSFRQSFIAPNYAPQVTLDVAGEWRVLVRDNVLTPTNVPYQLLVTDLTCGQNDSYEPNNVAALAADLTGTSRVFASLCAAADLDYFTFQSGANQQLTLNYPANPANATLTLVGANGELGRLDPGTQGKFDLSSAGWYTLTVANSGLSGSDALYMFQWQVGAPSGPNTGTPYVYYTDAFHFTRVALSADHIVEPLLVDAGALTWDTLATDTTRGWLYFYDLMANSIVRADLYGTNPQTIITDANPGGVVSVPHVAMAVDKASGRIYWLQPTGASASTASFIMRSNGDGTGTVQVVGNGLSRDSLVVDPIKGVLYWTENDTIRRSDLDGNGVTTLYTATSGNQVRDLALDPYAQKLYWLDPNQQTLFRANSDGTGITAIVTGLAAGARGVALQPLDNALYYSNGTDMMRAQLDGSGAAAIATLSGTYLGPSNLNPGTYLNTPIGTPGSSLAFGYNTPIVSPCALADIHEPNNDSGTATPLTVITQTDATGALCNTVIPNPTDMDYYHVTLADQKVLTATLTNLPADYRLVIIHPNGYAAAFSDNAGLTDELGVISNTSGAPVEYDILVMSGTPVQNYGQYQLTLTLGDVPPPPDPGDIDCYYADPYDAPAPGGNGTIGTATDLTLDAPIAAALCYSNDVDMYGFDGLDGQRLTIDLPIRPDNYTLTLYDPSGTAWATPAYGSQVTLDASGRWTIAVSHVPLTPTTSQYQLLVTDESCVSSDAYEPNDSTGEATLLSNNSRVRASLCSDNDVDTYHIWAIAGQQLTLNYPTNNTGSTLAVSSLGTVNSGTQGQFAIGSTGWVTVTVSNNTLSTRNVPYLFQATLGTPTTPTSDTPYVYYSNASDLTRVAVITRTIEPILMGNGAVGGSTIATDLTRGKLYILDHFERIVRVNFDGTGHEIIIPDADPNDILRFANGLAVDEDSGRIYWMEPQLGVVTNLMSANGDGTDVQTLVTTIANERAIAIDPIAGWVYWVEHSLYNGEVIDQIRRANLDGSDVTVVYAAPPGREIHDLAVDPYHQKLYWLDPTLRQVMWADSDGSDVDSIAVSLTSPTRGLIVRPLNNELYYTSGLNLVKATLTGGSPTTLARLEGSYSGVSNLDPGVFYLTGFSTPSSNLALGMSVPYAQPCTDAYEPNNSAGSAAAISTGSISSVLCTSNANQNDTQDYYAIAVPDGQQVDVTLTDLPQDYGLGLLQNDTWVDSSYTPGLVDEVVTGVNETGAAADYIILVERFGNTTSSNVPYTLNVNIGAPTPPPPPPPPPGDPCPAVDPYDAYGSLGNGSFANASPISFNTPITAALCYENDLDLYTFSGVIGQNVTVDLPVRPANYYVMVYKPDGTLFKMFHPAYSATYGDSITLSEGGNWYVGVWQPTLPPTTDQYQLLLSANTTCSGLDPYEPNDDQFNGHDFGASPPASLSAMLCETSDIDFFTFDVVVGQRVRITPNVLTPGMDMIIDIPGGGSGFTRDPIDIILRQDGEFILGFYSQETTENLPYEVDIQVDPVPTPTPLPNNWSCTTYPSSDIPQPIDDLTTVGSTVTVPVSGTVTHVGIKDIIFDHGGLYDVTFSLGAPNNTIADLFAFSATDQFYVWCGGSNCHMSLDDGAIPGLLPPQFPNNGGTFQPNLSSFAPFNGLPSLGTWTLFVTDASAPEPGDTDAGDTTGDLFSWGLEVCVDNGNPPDPTPTPSPTSTPPPQPTSGTPTPPIATGTPAPTPTATATSCAVNMDDYESDNTAGAATLFDMSTLTSGNHTFHTFTDKDWMSFSAIAGRAYTFSANKLGTSAPVSLAIYRSDGTTLEIVYTDEVSFTPSVTGDYYLVAGATTGTALPCNASYNVALTITNPDATPIPTPIGTPAPPDHDRPPVSSAIITPTNGTAVTDLAPVMVSVGLAADSGISMVALKVNGSSIDGYSAPSVVDAVWQTLWTPALTGVYTLTVDIIATNGMTATSPASIVYVDMANPTVSITTETITQALLRDDGLYGLHGTVSDDSRVRLVEVQIDGGVWQEAVLTGNNWLLPIAPLAQANANGGTLAITVRATDMAGRITTSNANLTLDVVAPDPFTITTSLTSGVLITPTQIITGLDSRLSWPVISGTVNVYAGWSAIVTPTLGTLTQYGAAAGSHDQLQVESTARYGHVVAVDANGNQTALTNGPFYFDGPQTPDLISDIEVSNWTDSGGKQVGQMNGTNYGTQQLFAGWNASHLRLRWNGINVDGNGDLYFYLGTTTGGSTDLFNPFGADDPGVLPFAADYVIHVSSSLTATLYTAGSGWTTVGPVAMTASGGNTDLLIPFASLGIATPASASLQLLGVASEESTLAVWATIPDKNLKQPTWTQYIQWASLGSGIVPANGVWANAQIEAAIAAYPDPAMKVGVGDTITLTLTYSNTGTAALPQLTVNGAGSGGVVVNNGPQTANNIQPGSGGTLTLLGTINASGSVDVTLADSYHRTYALETFVYTLDSAAPISISIALEYVGTLTNTIKATAEDESALATIEVEIDDGLPFGPTGIQIVTCVPGSGTGNAFVCNWNVGVVTDGNSYTLRGRATDIHGNVSSWSSPINVIGDATAPALTIGTVTQAALSDNKLGGHELVLDGTVVDERAAATTQVCLSETITVTTCLAGSVLPAPDNTWSLALPGNYNGITGTLSIVGFDKAGNPSNVFTQTLWLDTVSPVISTTVAPSYIQMIGGTIVTFTSGTTIDASGLMSATVVMLLPNGNSTIVHGTVNGNTWVVGYEFTLAGDYEAVLILTDKAGNLRYSPIWQFEVGSDPTAVRLLGLNIVNGQFYLPALVLTFLLLSGLTGLAFRLRWRMGMKPQK